MRARSLPAVGVARRAWLGCAAALASALALGGCYVLRGSHGGGEKGRSNERRVEPRDVAVPAGYSVTVVARGLTFPTGVAWDGAGALHVVESGYCYGEVWTTPRLSRVEADGALDPIASGGRNGPWNGVDFAGGSFFVAEGGALEGGRILRIDADGTIARLVEGLPSLGDHHTNGPLVRDGWVYFGQGTATNSGVVGEDSAAFGWLERSPSFCDVPGADVELRGERFETRDVLGEDGERGERRRTGAFAPFGSSGAARAEGAVAASGSVLRVPVAGGAIEQLAWGFRNPFGLAFAPDGALFVTDNGYDDRGSRPVWGAPDFLWRLEPGRWYGWPDYCGSRPLTADGFRPPGKPALELLLASPPGVPPEPVAALPVHGSADGFDFSRSEAFGHVGEAFVALLGDEAPATGKVLAPVGFQVVRVDCASGLVTQFAVNRGKRNGPASALGSGGLERPVAARFDPTGAALVVVDFGVIRHDDAGAHPVPGTGVLWRIERAGSTQ